MRSASQHWHSLKSASKDLRVQSPKLKRELPAPSMRFSSPSLLNRQQRSSKDWTRSKSRPCSRHTRSLSLISSTKTPTNISPSRKRPRASRQPPCSTYFYDNRQERSSSTSLKTTSTTGWSWTSPIFCIVPKWGGSCCSPLTTRILSSMGIPTRSLRWPQGQPPTGVTQTLRSGSEFKWTEQSTSPTSEELSRTHSKAE